MAHQWKAGDLARCINDDDCPIFPTSGRRVKADRAAINAKERQRIIDMMKAMPITQVKEQTGRSYFTLLRIAQVAL